MINKENKQGYENHPIQLITLKVLELSIKVIPESIQFEQPIVEQFSLFHGCSEYNHEDNTIGVRIGVEIGEELKEVPFKLRVEILGVFKVDENKFPLNFLEKWAENNAPLILYPYLREHVFSLSSRAGFDGTLLPLFQVPTFFK
ncbi:protein-export chaperone SecB [Candidatus Marithrix sp. Canyon 246]|uniref:protein-export chaperone SecB n=1 Tax=Candidatus Marithrix sp. Canyon 246 TaxID=1827136 RepID=UPI000849FECA|nr:protein-export chaperone SecB [Candidatus Marithrix sp. Canyon 246]